MSRASRRGRSIFFILTIVALLALYGDQPRATVLGGGAEVEPNGATATATPIGLPPGPNPVVRMTGSISPANDLDYFRLDVPSGNTDIWICTDTDANTNDDTLLTLLASNGTTVLEQDDNDGTGSGCGVFGTTNRRSSVIAGRALSAGTYYIKVQSSTANVSAISAYRMFVALTTVNYVVENDNNGTAATAQPLIPGVGSAVVVQGNINSSFDLDHYAITTTAGRTITVMASGDPERNLTSIDLALTLLSSNGTSVILTAQGPNEGAPNAPFAESFCYTPIVSGTYYVKVNYDATGPSPSTGNYTLFVAAPGGTRQWDGGAGGSNWTNPGNWNPDIVPAAGDALLFPAGAIGFSAASDFAAGTAFDAITFTGGSYTVSGNRIVLSNGVTNTGTASHTLSLPIDLASNQAFQSTQAAGGMSFTGSTLLPVRTGVNTLTVAGPGSTTIVSLLADAAAAPALIKNGTGTLSLPSAVIVNGRALTLNAGTTIVNASTASTPVTLAGGILGGTGTVGSVTATGGAISPGTSAGVLTTGNLALNSATTVSFELNGATAGSQYDQLNVAGTVALNSALFTFAANFTPPVGTAFVLIQNDLLDAVSGTFAGLPQGAVITDGARLYQIVYNGDTGNDVVLTRLADPSITINDVSVTETNSGTTNATFTVTLAPPSSSIVTVNFATANGTAIAPGDYTTTTGQLTFAALETTKTIAVPVIGDIVVEPNETFTVNLTGAVGAGIADVQGVGTIANDDGLPSLTINDVSGIEGNSGTSNATFTVTLSAASASGVTVNFATADGTATAPSDYTAASGQLTFAALETTKTVAVSVAGDALFEPNETFMVNLSGATNATIADAQGIGTITNDDTAPPTPSLTISDATIAEGSGGISTATFTVMLSAVSTPIVTVNFATADGTATAPGDYSATSGQLTFAGGQTTRTVTVSVLGDVAFEPDETFTVNLSGAANAAISDAQGVGTITNDDQAPPTPALTINDVTVTEGSTGTSNATFTVTLAPASSSTVAVNFATADGTAAAPGDYTTTTGQLTFAPFETTKMITVPIAGDVGGEPNETFTVNLSSALNATIGDPQGVVTITNDDPPPTSSLTINDVTVTEGNTGTTSATFTVTLSPASSSIVTVNFATAEGTANAPADYTTTTGQLAFAAQEITKTVTVSVAGDVALEPNETFTVNLTSAVNATIADPQGVGTITNDDVPATPAFTITDVSISEGNTGTSNFTFTVSLAPASSSIVTVNFATANGTATAPADYTTTSGQLTFAAQETAKTVTVPVVGDVVVEPSETFTVNLSGAVSATIADAQGVGTIANDDGLTGTPTVTITSPTANATTTATSPILTIGGTTASADVTEGAPEVEGPALSKVEGPALSSVDGPRAGAVTTVTWASNRGYSGTATGTSAWQCDVPLLAGANVITVTATDAGGQIGTDTVTVTVTNFIYYFAEGATGPFFDLELSLANPTTTAATVNLLFLKGDGTTVPVNTTVPAQERVTLLVDSLAGLAETAVSSIVTSLNAIPLGVERTMRWNTQGYGSHTEKATAGAHTTWLFAEGSEQAIFDTYLLLANPQPTANRATVTFLVENGVPVVKIYDLLPTSRTNVFAEVIPGLKEKSFGMAVSFDQPGVAERAMYFGTSVFWDGGHESAGVNEASTSWFHAEGATGPFFDTFILLSNPNGAPATVTLTFLLSTGETVVKTKVVPANARVTVIVEGEDAKLADAAMVTQVTATLPIVSERAMYWAQYPNWYEAHNSFGVTSTGTKWALGEGRVGGTFGFETYILLANPGATPANVTITFLREAGLAPITRTYTVNATSRFNIYANAADIGLTSGERFGALIVSTVPIAVERAMYSNSPLQPGVVWAAGTNASATKIP